MDFSNLAKLGTFLGGIAALGGVAIAVVGYIGSRDQSNINTASTPVEISVLTSDAVSQTTSAKVQQLKGLWIADPMEIYSDISADWLANKDDSTQPYYDATVSAASVEIENAEQNGEMIANIKLANDVYDHRFRGIAKVSGDDIWLLKVRHLKQYGAEPNLNVSTAEMEIVDNGMLYVDMKMPGYSDVSFFANPDGVSDRP